MCIYVCVCVCVCMCVFTCRYYVYTYSNHCDNYYSFLYTVEPLNNGHGGDDHFVHCSEVVPSSEVEMYGQLMAGARVQAVCPL